MGRKNEDIKKIKGMKLKCTCGRSAIGFKKSEPVCNYCWKGVYVLRDERRLSK